MKTILVIFLSLPLYSFSQSKPAKFYINPNLVLRKAIQWNSPGFGADINGGIIIKKFGIGAGIDYFKVYSDLPAATPVFLDLRYFFIPGKNLAAFAAVDAGKMIWSASQTNGPSVDNFTTTFDGKSYLGFEAGVIFSKKGKQGFLAALGFKNYPVTRAGIHRGTLLPNGTIGPYSETKYPGITDKHSEVFLKIGYNF